MAEISPTLEESVNDVVRRQRGVTPPAATESLRISVQREVDRQRGFFDSNLDAAGRSEDDPRARGRALQLAEDAGVSQRFAVDNVGKLERGKQAMENKRDVGHMNSPAMDQHLQTPDMALAVRDDIPMYKGVKDALEGREHPSVLEAIKARIAQGKHLAWEGPDVMRPIFTEHFGGARATVAERRAAQAYEKMDFGPTRVPGTWVDDIIGGTGQQIMIQSATAFKAGIAGGGAAIMAGLAAAIFSPPGTRAVTVPNAARLALKWVGTAGAVFHIFEMERVGSFLELANQRNERGELITFAERMDAATIVGAMAAPTEFLSQFITVFGRLPGFSQAKRAGRRTLGKFIANKMANNPGLRAWFASITGRIATRTVAVMGSETLTENIQQLESIAVKRSLSGREVWSTTFTDEEIAELKDVTFQTLASTVILGGAGGVGQVISDKHLSVSEAKRDKARMDIARKLIRESPARAQSPAIFRRLTTEIAKEAGIEEIGIPMDKLMELYQEDPGLDVSDLARDIPEIADKIGDASYKGDVSIPVGRYFETLDKRFGDKLVEDMRINDGHTIREARELVVADQKETDALVKEESKVREEGLPAEATVNEQRANESADRIYQKVKGILTKNTTMPKEAIEKNALIWRNRGRARSKRNGRDPYEMFLEENPEVRTIIDDVPLPPGFLELQQKLPSTQQRLLTEARQQIMSPGELDEFAFRRFPRAIRQGDQVFVAGTPGDLHSDILSRERFPLELPPDVEQGFVVDGQFTLGEDFDPFISAFDKLFFGNELFQMVFEERRGPGEAKPLISPFQDNPKPGAEGRIRRKLNRQQAARAKKVGRQKNKRVRVTLKDGSIYHMGQHTVVDWSDQVASVGTPEQIAKWRRWYADVHDTFQGVFGDQSPLFAAAWLIGQQKTSPIDALRHALRVREQVLTGINGVKGGLAHQRLVDFWTNVLEKAGLDNVNKSIDGGQKLRDFVDAALGRETRSFMGNDARGGQPVPIDVHSGRDAGFVDKTLLIYLARKGVPQKTLNKLTIDMKGAPSETQYEHAAEFFHEVRDHLNANNLFGGDFKLVAEVQALGWMSLLHQLGLPPADGQIAIQRSTQNVSTALLFGDNAPYKKRFKALLSLPYKEQEEITAGANYVALSHILPLLGDPPVTSFQTAAGGWMDFDAEPSTQFELLSSDEVADDIAAAMAVLTQQTETRVERTLVMTPAGALPKGANSWFVDITHETGELSDSGELIKFWNLIREELPSAEGYHAFQEGDSVGIRMGLQFAKPKVDKDGNLVLDKKGDVIQETIQVPKLDDQGNPILDKEGQPVTEPHRFAGAKKGRALVESEVVAGVLRAINRAAFDATIRAGPGTARLSDNDWGAQPDGQGHILGLPEARRSNTQAAINRARPALESYLESSIKRAVQARDRAQGKRELEQAEGVKRGSILISPEVTDVVIRLTESQNISTFLHESGHLFMFQLFKDARAEGASQQLKDDTQTILDWFGVTSFDQIGDRQHDQWARSWEAYLRTGKAPSLELRGVFGQFRRWLLELYPSMKELFLKGEPPQAITEVMDRLIATDEEIAIARETADAEFTPSRVEAFEKHMNPDERLRYRRAIDLARESSNEQVTKQILADLERKRTTQWRDDRERIREEVELDVNERRVFQARHFLETGEMLDESPAPSLEKMDRDKLIDLVGQAKFRRLPFGNRGVHKKNGSEPELVAELFGYANAAELVDDILDSGSRLETIKAETDIRAGLELGDIMEDGRLRDAALEAIDTPDKFRVFLIEERAITRKGGGQVTPVRAARIAAERMIEDTPVQELRPHRFRQAAARHGRAALEALNRGDFLTARASHSRQVINTQLELEARLQRDKTATAHRTIRTFEKVSKQKKMGLAGFTFRQQANDILRRFDFRALSVKAGERRQSLAKFIQAQRDLDEPVAIPESIQEEAFTKPWKELTVRELLDVRDALVNIDKLSSRSVEVIRGRQKRELGEITGAISGDIRSNFAERPAIASEGLGDNYNKQIRSADSSMRRGEFVIDQLTRGDPLSVLRQTVWDPLQDAQIAYQDLLLEKSNAIQTIMDTHIGPDKLISYHKILDETRLSDAEGRVFGKVTKWWLISAALNLGNESNKQKLLTGYGWTEDQLMEVLNTHLTEPGDWLFIEAIWKEINTLWPAAKALEERMTGIAPPKIVGTPLVTPFGTIEGGYYPVVWDRDKSNMGARTNPVGLIPGVTDGFTRVTTGHGNLIERIDEASAPIKLSIDVIGTHIDQVILDLTHREAIENAARILSSQQVDTAMRDAMGSQFSYQDYWKPLLRHVARDNNDPGQIGFWNRVARGVRMNGTVYTLGLRTTTLVMQIGGLQNGYKFLQRRIPEGKDVRTNLLHALRGTLLQFNNAKAEYKRVTGLSGFMRLRVGNINRDMREIMRRATNAGSFIQAAEQFNLGRPLQTVSEAADDFRKWSMRLIAYTQLFAVDLPLWLAAEKSGIDQLNMTPEQAARFADSIVRQSQGAGTKLDQASVERGGVNGNELMRGTTMFYSYNNAVYNQIADARLVPPAGKDEVEFSHKLAGYGWYAFGPGLFASAVHVVFGTSGPDPTEDDFENQLMDEFVEIVIGEPLGTIPWVRELWRGIATGQRVTGIGIGDQLFREGMDLRNPTDGMDVMFDVMRVFAIAGGFPGQDIFRRVESAIRAFDE